MAEFYLHISIFMSGGEKKKKKGGRRGNITIIQYLVA